MRWIAGVAIALLLAAAAATCATALWVHDALRALAIAPSPVCLTVHDAARLRAGGFSPSQQDDWIVRELTFITAGHDSPSLQWHLREALIDWTFRSFWSQAERKVNFARLIARARPCVFAPGLPAPPAGG